MRRLITRISSRWTQHSFGVRGFACQEPKKRSQFVWMRTFWTGSENRDIPINLASTRFFAPTWKRRDELLPIAPIFVPLYQLKGVAIGVMNVESLRALNQRLVIGLESQCFKVCSRRSNILGVQGYMPRSLRSGGFVVVHQMNVLVS